MTNTDAATTGQVTRTAAEIYESFFVPALFGQWPSRLLDMADLSPTDRVLDVGCGTGILARAATGRVPEGTVTGLDQNDGMLAVARRSDATVTWRQGSAEALPFPDESFDHVFSQFALMFFADQVVGLQEMLRVLRPGGSATIATWADVAKSPGYAAMIQLLKGLFGDAAANALHAPFTLGSTAVLTPLLRESFPEATITEVNGTARFESIEAWVHTDVRGWTLADLIDDKQYDQLLTVASTELQQFVDDDGAVRFDAPALIISATKN